MKRLLPFLGLVAAVVLLASAACWITMRVAARRAVLTHADAHQWIHTQLRLTREQEAKLVPIEERYDAQKKHLGKLIRLANMELGQAVLADEENSPRVQAAVAKIKDAQGQLQEATLRHVFDMKAVLTPEQYKTLLNLTANALYEVNHAE